MRPVSFISHIPKRMYFAHVLALVTRAEKCGNLSQGCRASAITMRMYFGHDPARSNNVRELSYTKLLKFSSAEETRSGTRPGAGVIGERGGQTIETCGNLAICCRASASTLRRYLGQGDNRSLVIPNPHARLCCRNLV